MGDIMRTLLKCLVASVALFGVLTAYAAAPTEINLHIQNSSTSTITPSDVTGIYSGGPKLSAINASQTGNFYIIQKGASVVQFKYGWDASNYCQFNLSFSNATTYSNGTAVSKGNASCEVSGSGNQVQLTVGIPMITLNNISLINNTTVELTLNPGYTGLENGSVYPQEIGRGRESTATLKTVLKKGSAATVKFGYRFYIGSAQQACNFSLNFSESGTFLTGTATSTPVGTGPTCTVSQSDGKVQLTMTYLGGPSNVTSCKSGLGSPCMLTNGVYSFYAGGYSMDRYAGIQPKAGCNVTCAVLNSAPTLSVTCAGKTEKFACPLQHPFQPGFQPMWTKVSGGFYSCQNQDPKTNPVQGKCSIQ